jgi:hypothetical protein
MNMDSCTILKKLFLNASLKMSGFLKRRFILAIKEGRKE